MRQHWDIFCTVVDNFGDIGVCWRLAKQLAHEHRKTVRLWIDDLASFSRIAPDIDPAAERQFVQGIEIFLWQTVFRAVEPADVVIEAFACELPEAYVLAMLQPTRQPVWINLEYLSAEPWVGQYHGLPSPHPRLPLTKTFFFPGFVPSTGGLLREKNLMAQRLAFTNADEQAFWRDKNLPQRNAGELRISLFGYDNAPVDNLIAALSISTAPVFLIVPMGKLAKRILSLFGCATSQCAASITHERLTVRIIPFMSQMEYDRLLWSCDVNFVRGEDSFVRTQWAGKPFVWNIYPQHDTAHWKKLDAFLDLYTTDMPQAMAAAVRAMWSCWNGKAVLNTSIWMNFLSMQESLMQHNRNWSNRLMKQDDLASNLVRFAENKL